MWTWGIVLVLAETELNLFTVACMGLCLAEKGVGNPLVDNSLVLLVLSRTYTTARPFVLLRLPCQQVGWGCREAGRRRIWDS